MNICLAWVFCFADIIFKILANAPHHTAHYWVVVDRVNKRCVKMFIIFDAHHIEENIVSTLTACTNKVVACMLCKTLQKIKVIVLIKLYKNIIPGVFFYKA